MMRGLPEQIFRAKYALYPSETWEARAWAVVEDICGTGNGKQRPLLAKDEQRELREAIKDCKIIPGGRVLYYAGRDARYYQNCYLFRAEEDTREEWGRLIHAASDALMAGGGIGIDYSRLRGRGERLSRTGGVASGPLALALAVNEYGRHVRQGGSRRSAMLASLDHRHPDVLEWIKAKDWYSDGVPGTDISYGTAKERNWEAHAPLDMTNVSISFGDDWDGSNTGVFRDVLHMAAKTGEPGWLFNFGEDSNETLRNACGELTSEDDSDVCTLASVNMARVGSAGEMYYLSELAARLLYCVCLRGELPNEKMQKVVKSNRRLGLGLMGLHEWMLRNSLPYAPTPRLHRMLEAWKKGSKAGADSLADSLGSRRPIGYRAVAPTGTIAMLASTTSGIEPIFAAGYQRRWLAGKNWRSTYHVDAITDKLVKEGIDPDNIETAHELASDPARRLAVQACVQHYTDHAIASTINLPAWGSPNNNPDTLDRLGEAIVEYAPELRGVTLYPDGARGGQPLVPCGYHEALKKKAVVEDNSETACRSGVCGI